MSKVWTATLAMQLVDEGKLDLDAPVAEVLPELRLADAEVAKTVTMRHLLTHTSGIDGDVFTDTGRGDDCVEKYVALLAEQKQNHPLGATWSYCNAGFVLAGRVIEKLTGLTWDAALRQQICAPLGLRHTVTLPEEALLFRTAAGHVDVTGDPVLAPVWQLPRSLGPAGLICSTPADVLAFARMHLTGGLAADGTRVLSAASAAAMTELQADLPDKYSLGDSWGIGWIRFGWDGQRLVGHDGNTIGQAAFLRVLPDPDTGRARGHPAHQRRPRPRPVRRPVPGDLRRAGRRRHARPDRAARRARRGGHHPAPGPLRAGRVLHGGPGVHRRRRRARRCGPRSPGRSRSWCPTRCTSTR